MVRVTLPPKGPPRDRWLTRDEAAKLVWACWRYREKQTVHRGQKKGQEIDTDKRPLRHLARFILIGLYTGTRAGAIASASPYRQVGHSFVDLSGDRLAIGRRATKKRQSPAPIPHTLRHTAATWLMQRGVPIWQAAGYLGMSADMIERTYGHHHPDYMRAAAQAITSKQQQNVSLIVSLVEPENGSRKSRKN